MNDLNSPGDLAGQMAALQRQVFTLLLALIVVSGTIAAYLGYESYHLGKDINGINAQVVQPYKQKLPVIESFVSQIVAYGQAHPDFRPLLVKNGVVAATPPPAASVPAKPAPAAPAAPKK
jgi:archaellum component FlaG (FlaF/FlaG flagellin family)